MARQSSIPGAGADDGDVQIALAGLLDHSDPRRRGNGQPVSPATEPHRLAERIRVGHGANIQRYDIVGDFDAVGAVDSSCARGPSRWRCRGESARRRSRTAPPGRYGRRASRSGPRRVRKQHARVHRMAARADQSDLDIRDWRAAESGATPLTCACPPPTSTRRFTARRTDG